MEKGLGEISQIAQFLNYRTDIVTEGSGIWFSKKLLKAYFNF